MMPGYQVQSSKRPWDELRSMTRWQVDEALYAATYVGAYSLVKNNTDWIIDHDIRNEIEDVLSNGIAMEMENGT